MIPAAAWQDAERWDAIQTHLSISTMKGVAVGAIAAAALFGRPWGRTAAISACTGAGLGMGWTKGQLEFSSNPRDFLPTRLAEAPADRIWDYGMVNSIKNTGVGLLAGLPAAIFFRSAIGRIASLCVAGGIGAGIGIEETKIAVDMAAAAPVDVSAAES